MKGGLAARADSARRRVRSVTTTSRASDPGLRLFEATRWTRSLRAVAS
jgi:hypothetical protein